MSEPQVILIGGPSGSGKSTLIARLLEIPGTRLAVSATTRPPREGEVDGVAYHFLAPDAFATKCEGGQLLEWAEVFGNSYGTPRSEIEARGPGDRLVILDLDVQGLRSLLALGPPLPGSGQKLGPSASSCRRQGRTRFGRVGVLDPDD